MNALESLRLLARYNQWMNERLYALLGYELVEGRLAGRASAERIEDRRRVSFTPVPTTIGRYSPFD